MHQSVGPKEIHPRVLRELAGEVAKPHYLSCLKGCGSLMKFSDWKRGKKQGLFVCVK